MKLSKKIIILAVVVLTTTLYSQSRPGWGLGISVGDPTGFTAKYNMDNKNAWNFNIGSSYFGEIRVGADYLWHFDPFNSRYVAMHAGFGPVLGFGNGNSVIFKNDNDAFLLRDDDEIGIGVRGLVGVDFYPSSSPFEIFFEMGPLLGLAPETGSAFDVAVGFRFYP